MASDRSRSCLASAGPERHRDVLQAAGGERMLGTIARLEYLLRLPEQTQPGLDVAPAVLHDRQTAQAVSHIRVSGSSDPSLNRQRPLVGRNRFVVAFHLPVQCAQVVQHSGDIQMVLAEHAYAHGERLFV